MVSAAESGPYTNSRTACTVEQESAGLRHRRDKAQFASAPLSAEEAKALRQVQMYKTCLRENEEERVILKDLQQMIDTK